MLTLFTWKRVAWEYVPESTYSNRWQQGTTLCCKYRNRTTDAFGIAGIRYVLSLQLSSRLTVEFQRENVRLSQYICTKRGRYYGTIRISEARGKEWYNNIYHFQYNYVEIETPFPSQTGYSQLNVLVSTVKLPGTLLKARLSQHICTTSGQYCGIIRIRNRRWVEWYRFHHVLPQ